jgi:hypothetical protein
VATAALDVAMRRAARWKCCAWPASVPIVSVPKALQVAFLHQPLDDVGVEARGMGAVLHFLQVDDADRA